jgi:PqqD family protein of HPr-rel-A system
VERVDEGPRARPDLTVVELDGEAVIYDEATGDLHRLNATATVVFSLLDGSTTLDDLSADLAATYGVPPTQVGEQVRALVDGLAGSHLLVGAEPDPAEGADR